jgi:hypothetical protein
MEVWLHLFWIHFSLSRYLARSGTAGKKILYHREKGKNIVIFHFFNPILHTAWLDSHALTLKRNTAKYYFCEKFSFLPTFLNVCCESSEYLLSMHVLNKVKQTCHDLFKILDVSVWLGSHHIFEIYTLSGYRT